MSGLVMSTLFVFVLGLVFTLGVKIIPIFWVRFKKEEITARLILLYSLSMLMVVVSGLALFATPVFERLYNRGNWASEPGGWTLLGILMLFWIAVYFDLLWLLVVVPAAWILAAYPLAEPSYGVMGTITEFLLSPPTFEIGFAALRILNPLILITMVMIFGAILGKKIIGETLTASIVFAFIGAILSYACIFTLLMAAG
jgi:hypothetical protein